MNTVSWRLEYFLNKSNYRSPNEAWKRAMINCLKTNYCTKDHSKILCLITSSLFLTVSWRRPLSYRNQSINLRNKSMDWFLYDDGLRHERVNHHQHYCVTYLRCKIWFSIFPDITLWVFLTAHDIFVVFSFHWPSLIFHVRLDYEYLAKHLTM